MQKGEQRQAQACLFQFIDFDVFVIDGLSVQSGTRVAVSPNVDGFCTREIKIHRIFVFQTSAMDADAGQQLLLSLFGITRNTIYNTSPPGIRQ